MVVFSLFFVSVYYFLKINFFGNQYDDIIFQKSLFHDGILN